MSVLLALLLAFGLGTSYEDGSAVAVIEWTAPECPDIDDEPCYWGLVRDAETQAVSIITGP